MGRSGGRRSLCRIGQNAEPPPPRSASPTWLRRLWRLVPGRIRRYLEARFSDVSTSEARGYAVWSAMGVVVGVPEIWAAIEGDDFYWPTISTTIGHLQERWPVVALLPVAAIVMGGYSVFRIRTIGDTVFQADLQALGRTPQGRLVKQDVARSSSQSAASRRPRRSCAAGPFVVLLRARDSDRRRHQPGRVAERQPVPRRLRALLADRDLLDRGPQPRRVLLQTATSRITNLFFTVSFARPARAAGRRPRRRAPRDPPAASGSSTPGPSHPTS